VRKQARDVLGGDNIFTKDGRALQVFFSEADVRAIQESLADFICSLCMKKYRDHWDADHFFEYTEDLDPD
jgi:hypothetical protein